MTTATTTTAAATIASLAEVFVPANVGEGDKSDRGDGLPPGSMLAVLAPSWLRSSGPLPAGFPASPDGGAPMT